MYFSHRGEEAADSKKQNHVCPKCGFENRTTAIYCEICFSPLEAVNIADVNYVIPTKSPKVESPPPVESPPSSKHL